MNAMYTALGLYAFTAIAAVIGFYIQGAKNDRAKKQFHGAGKDTQISNAGKGISKVEQSVEGDRSIAGLREAGM